MKRKLTDVDFIEYVKHYDVLFFGETWISKTDLVNLDIEGYHSEHVFACKALGARKGRYSGGVSVYIKNSLKDNVVVVGKNDYGLLWLKICGQILNHNTDTFIGYLYAREKNSRVSRHEDVDYFEILEADIAKFQNLGKVLVTGDFNARTGTSTDFIVYDRYIDVGPDEDIVRYTDIPERVNKDRVIDTYGRRLLELCKSTNLLIANGRWGFDNNIGDFTYLGERGCSVVDYLILPLLDFDTVSSFKINDVTEFSDHAGLSFKLKCKTLSSSINKPASEQSCERKLRWDNEKLMILKIVLII